CGWTSQPRAIAARAASSTARRLSTGSAPGRPRQTGHSAVFGSAPNRVEQPQKILVAVSSCAWISSPMTGSKAGTQREIVPRIAPLRLHDAFEDGHHGGIELGPRASLEFGDGFARRDRVAEH